VVKTRKLRHITSAYCTQYKTDAKFFIQDEHPSGVRHLVVHYEKGGYDGRPEFVAAIPADWTEAEIQDFILWSIKDPSAPYPAWEVPARAYGSSMLFRR
jgi:hypothetical protein